MPKIIHKSKKKTDNCNVDNLVTEKVLVKRDNFTTEGGMWELTKHKSVVFQDGMKGMFLLQ